MDSDAHKPQKRLTSNLKASNSGSKPSSKEEKKKTTI
jgi:hypothetical protein